MDSRLEIALAIHEGACRIMARPQPSRCLPAIAVAESKEAMARIIPDFDDISFDLVYLLDPHARAAAASEQLRNLAMKAANPTWEPSGLGVKRNS